MEQARQGQHMAVRAIKLVPGEQDQVHPERRAGQLSWTTTEGTRTAQIRIIRWAPGREGSRWELEGNAPSCRAVPCRAVPCRAQWFLTKASADSSQGQPTKQSPSSPIGNPRVR
eukprot:SAG22_NODE_910_length_6547_cov_2.044975_10_plen_114_part_00